MELVNIFWKSSATALFAIVSNILCTFVSTNYFNKHSFMEATDILAHHDVIFSTSRPSEISCAWSCHKAEGCVSFFFNTWSGTCLGVREPCAELTETSGDQTDVYRCWSNSVDSRDPRDCLDVYSRNHSADDGVYSVTTETGSELDVYCLMSQRDGGWTILMRRFNGELLFNRSFEDYEEGFGNKSSEHWLGLRYIHEMTGNATSDIHISSFGGIFPGQEKEVYEEWSGFSVGPGPNYTMRVGELLTWTYDYTSFVDHFFNTSTGHDFTTDFLPEPSCKCPDYPVGGGFWFSCCFIMNPTGIYGAPSAYGGQYMFNELAMGKNALAKMTFMYRRNVSYQDDNGTSTVKP